MDCLRSGREGALEPSLSAHLSARRSFSLPTAPPKDEGGIVCDLCSAHCMMGDGSVGYCGIRRVEGGRLRSLGSPEEALLHHYLDAQVTNCCSAWFCPAGTGAGYPNFARSRGPEYGYYNLALFFYGCCFDCLFCQNWSHKMLSQAERVRADDLVGLTLKNDKISCWCWFGGSPEPQLPFAVNASRKLLESKRGERVVRICYEWNGDGNPVLVKRAAQQVLQSGGNIKFDLKAFDPLLHVALTGRSNERPLLNFEAVYEGFWQRRRELPMLTATTLLVPHYVDHLEVGRLAEFIASLDDEIPYSLLVFHPEFRMLDLPVTPWRQVEECYASAKRFLKNVHVGNAELLGAVRKGRLNWVAP